MEDLTFGQRLVHYRTRLKMLQKELAEKAGISSTALNYYEKDKREPNVITIINLAKALGVTGDDLLGIDTSTAPVVLTNEEISLVKAYRNNPDMQIAVNRLLGIVIVQEEHPGEKKPHIPDIEQISKEAKAARKVMDATIPSKK